MKWKPDWPQAKQNHIRWWNRDGMVLWLTAGRADSAAAAVATGPATKPTPPTDIATRWCDPRYRAAADEWGLAHTHYFADAFPYFCAQIGPGSLGTFLGSTPHFAADTVWYEPCIPDPAACGPLRLKQDGNHWLDVHLALLDECLRLAGGQVPVCMPDLIENLDTLAALRDTEPLMTDLLERPEWVLAKLWEINEAFFAAFDLIHRRVRDTDGGNVFAFSIWGPGRTAKLQCDLSCMLSGEMFRRFVAPPLTAQCQWLDFSMYHLDGEDALHHLDTLLAIEPLDAIEWTPRLLSTGLASEAGGSPKFYDLYRRIKAAGKSVQAVCVRPDQVVPLLDAVGPEAMFIQTWAADEPAAEKILKDVEQFR